MLRVSVQNGTNAGHRIIRDKRHPWTCSQGHKNAAHWANCPTDTCGEKRPK